MTEEVGRSVGEVGDRGGWEEWVGDRGGWEEWVGDRGGWEEWV